MLAISITSAKLSFLKWNWAFKKYCREQLKTLSYDWKKLEWPSRSSICSWNFILSCTQPYSQDEPVFNMFKFQGLTLFWIYEMLIPYLSSMNDQLTLEKVKRKNTWKGACSPPSATLFKKATDAASEKVALQQDSQQLPLVNDDKVNWKQIKPKRVHFFHIVLTTYILMQITQKMEAKMEWCSV